MLTGGSGKLSSLRIADAFGRAAHTYDEHARLQRKVAQRLLDGLPGGDAGISILDLGCGTGYCTGRLADNYPRGDIFGLDISPAMLARARDKYSGISKHFVRADARHLPFADRTFDLLVSSLTIQWCGDYPGLFRELGRVMKQGGSCILSTFGPLTLEQLRRAWGKVDSHVHVNDFAEAKVLLDCAAEAFNIRQFRREEEIRFYPDLGSLGTELKAIGANTVFTGRPQGLTGRGRLQKLQREFAREMVEQKGIPVTYEVFYLELQAL